MFVYWLLFLIPVLAELTPVRLNRRSQLFCWGLVWLIFTVLIGLRHEVGGDWIAYLFHLELRSKMELAEILTASDPGYYLINWCVGQLGGGIHWVNLICAAIVMTGVVRFACYQPQPWVALAVSVPYLLIVVAMGYTRQAAALGLLLVALVSLGKGRTIAFVLWVLLAATFHKSAVLIMPFAALAATSHRMWSFAWVGLISLIGSYLFVFDSAGDLWQNYVEANYESQGGIIRVAMNAVPAFIFLLLHRRLQLTVSERRLWWWMSIFALVCVPLVMMSSTATDRVALYLIPLQLFVFSRVHLLASSSKGRAFIVLCVLGYYCAVQFVWLNFASHAFAWIPYQMLWLMPDNSF